MTTALPSRRQLVNAVRRQQRLWLAIPMLSASAVIATCGEKPPVPPAQPHGQQARVVQSSPTARTTCFDALEPIAIRCVAPLARRMGDSLRIRFDDGTEKVFVNVEGPENNDYWYRYVGRLGKPAYHVVEASHSETEPTYILLNARTGRLTEGLDSIAISPDSTRIATIAEGWDNCAEGGGARFVVWLLTDSVPVKEVDEHPSTTCGNFAYWAPADARWSGPDTVRYTRFEVPAPAQVSGNEFPSRVVMKVRSASGWRTIE